MSPTTSRTNHLETLQHEQDELENLVKKLSRSLNAASAARRARKDQYKQAIKKLDQIYVYKRDLQAELWSTYPSFIPIPPALLKPQTFLSSQNLPHSPLSHQVLEPSPPLPSTSIRPIPQHNQLTTRPPQTQSSQTTQSASAAQKQTSAQRQTSRAASSSSSRPASRAGPPPSSTRPRRARPSATRAHGSTASARRRTCCVRVGSCGVVTADLGFWGHACGLWMGLGGW